MKNVFLSNLLQDVEPECFFCFLFLNKIYFPIYIISADNGQVIENIVASKIRPIQ